MYQRLGAGSKLLDFFINEAQTMQIPAYVEATRGLHPLCHARGFQTMSCASRFEMPHEAGVEVITHFKMRRQHSPTIAQDAQDTDGAHRQPAALPRGSVPGQPGQASALQRDSLTHQDDIRPGDSGQPRDQSDGDDDDDDDGPSPGGAGIAAQRNDSIAIQRHAIQMALMAAGSESDDDEMMGPRVNPYNALSVLAHSAAAGAVQTTWEAPVVFREPPVPRRDNVPPPPFASPAYATGEAELSLPSFESMDLGDGVLGLAIGQDDDDDDLYSTSPPRGDRGRGPRQIHRTVYGDQGDSASDTFTYRPTFPPLTRRNGASIPTLPEDLRTGHEHIDQARAILLERHREEPENDLYAEWAVLAAEEERANASRATNRAIFRTSQRVATSPDFNDQLYRLRVPNMPDGSSRSGYRALRPVGITAPRGLERAHENRRASHPMTIDQAQFHPYLNGFTSNQDSPPRSPPTRAEVDGYDVNADSPEPLITGGMRDGPALRTGLPQAEHVTGEGDSSSGTTDSDDLPTIRTTGQVPHPNFERGPRPQQHESPSLLVRLPLPAIMMDPNDSDELGNREPFERRQSPVPPSTQVDMSTVRQTEQRFPRPDFSQGLRRPQHEQARRPDGTPLRGRDHLHPEPSMAPPPGSDLPATTFQTAEEVAD